MGPGEDAELRIELEIAEDSRRETFVVRPEELAAGPVRHGLGGADLHLTVERLAAAADLPLRVSGEVTVRPPVGESAIYLEARQADGHRVWTSPLFLTAAA